MVCPMQAQRHGPQTPAPGTSSGARSSSMKMAAREERGHFPVELISYLLLLFSQGEHTRTFSTISLAHCQSPLGVSPTSSCRPEQN